MTGEVSARNLKVLPSVRRFKRLSHFDLPNASIPGLDVVVAIPARDEAECIEACLQALAHQRDGAGRPIEPGRFAVLLLANNCRDDTVARARRITGLPFSLVCHEIELPPGEANAGGARRLALDLAASLLEAEGGDNGLLFTTDADTRVSASWIADNLAAVANGADAVAGSIGFDPGETARYPGLTDIRPLEARYAALSDELVAAIDPRPHDPWPNHRLAWGASLAVRLQLYRRVGGMPPVALAEDRAFVKALEAQDARVRHALNVRVCTSARTRGRAPGGLADMLASFAEDKDFVCDALLETSAATVRRAAWRAKLHRLYVAGELSAHASDWSPRLRLTNSAATALIETGSGPFGEIWQAIEQASPLLHRNRLHPRFLPKEIACVEHLLARLKGAGAAGPGGRAPVAPGAEPGRPAPCFG